jgi:3-methyladenine DNA glycosylase AlkD
MLAKSYAQHPGEAITELRRLAADANWEVREWAGSATGDVFGDHFDELYPVMEDWLRDPSQFVRRAVAIALMGASDRKRPERAEPLLALADMLVRDPAEGSSATRDRSPSGTRCWESTRPRRWST